MSSGGGSLELTLDLTPVTESWAGASLHLLRRGQVRKSANPGQTGSGPRSGRHQRGHWRNRALPGSRRTETHGQSPRVSGLPSSRCGRRDASALGLQWPTRERAFQNVLWRAEGGNPQLASPVCPLAGREDPHRPVLALRTWPVHPDCPGPRGGSTPCIPGAPGPGAHVRAEEGPPFPEPWPRRTLRPDGPLPPSLALILPGWAAQGPTVLVPGEALGPGRRPQAPPPPPPALTCPDRIWAWRTRVGGRSHPCLRPEPSPVPAPGTHRASAWTPGKPWCWLPRVPVSPWSVAWAPRSGFGPTCPQPRWDACCLGRPAARRPLQRLRTKEPEVHACAVDGSPGLWGKF